MQESDTYQAILDEGAEKAFRQTLLRLGKIRFGPPGEAVTAKVQTITDLDRLEALLDRVLTASNWQELLEES